MSLLAVPSVTKFFRRWKNFKKYTPPGGTRVPGGPAYFPRFKDEKDPEIIPSKLFKVERIKRVKFTTRIERGILKQLDLDMFGRKIAIVKNIPENNCQLWKIKHLIKIVPITFPHGEPTENDIGHTILKENGECLVTKELQEYPKRVEAWDAVDQNPKKMDGKSIEKFCRYKWLSGWNGGL